MKNHPFEYLLSGTLLTTAFAFFIIVVSDVSPEQVKCYLRDMESMGIFVNALGTLLIFSISYPLGYMLNTISYQVLNRSIRKSIYNDMSSKIPDNIKYELERIYRNKLDNESDDIAEDLKWDGPDKYLILISVELLALNSDVHSRASYIWESQSRFFRVFYLSSLIVLLIIITCIIATQLLNVGSLLKWGSHVFWFSIVFIFGLISIANRYLYKKALKYEFISYFNRYLTIKTLLNEKSIS